MVKKNRNWVLWDMLGGSEYRARCVEDTWLKRYFRSGSELFGTYALSIWLADGPKVFEPASDQCEAMENIEVNVHLSDYAQPYPATMIVLPRGRYGTFHAVICHYERKMLTCMLFSDGHLNDVTTTIAIDGRPMEESIVTFDPSCDADGEVAAKVLRVAINSCLCLVNYGCDKRHLWKAAVEADRRLAGEQSERGERARERLRLSPQVLEFTQRVTLRAAPSVDAGDVTYRNTGRTVRTHWRKGHWAMVACGRGRAERRRVLKRPCLVRADLFAGDASDTVAVYKCAGEK